MCSFASAGGPVWLPKIYDGRNRTFWFVSYEGLRQRQVTFDQDYVPTPAMFSGDFSQGLSGLAIVGARSPPRPSDSTPRACP
jgi:hypothetical protein